MGYRGLLTIGAVVVFAGGLVWMVAGPVAGPGVVGNSNVVGGMASAAALVLTTLLELRRRWRGGDQGTPAIELVAAETLRYWERQAKNRRLTTPSPAAVSWRWGDPDVAVPAREIQPRLLTKGVVTELRHQLYRRLRRPARIAILGGPGAGKTSAMLLLLIDVLREREPGSTEPVPVWLTLGGWNPSTTPLRDWAATTMRRTYQTLGALSVAEDLITSGQVALFLDGLDEMPAWLRVEAIDALDRDAAGMRLVMTSRPDEYRATMQERRLWTTAVIDVRPVEPAAAAKFLLAEQLGERRESWQHIARELNSNPSGVVGSTLTSPLALALTREAYAHSDPRELVEGQPFATSDDLMRHLLGRSLEMAYPDGDERRRAVDWLSWMAREMGEKQDLCWWDIPFWGSRSRQTMAVIGGLTGGFLGAAALGLWFGPVAGIFAGAVLGLGTTLAITLADDVGLGLDGGMGRSRRVSFGRWLATLAVLVVVLPIAIYAMGPALGLTVGIVVALIFQIVVRIIRETEWEPRRPSPDPVRSFRSDLLKSPTKLAKGLVFGAAMGMVLGVIAAFFTFWLPPIASGCVVAVGAAAGLGLSMQGQINASLFLQLSQVGWLVRGRPIRFMPFLRDALDRQVLRQVGPVYQFRHGLLRDYLRNSAVTEAALRG